MSRKNTKTAVVANVETVALPVNAVPFNLDDMLSDLAVLEAEADKLAEAELAAEIVAAAEQADAEDAGEDEATEDQAIEAPATGQAIAEQAEADEVEHVPGDLKEIIKTITDDDRQIMRSYVHDAFDRRLQFEAAHGNKKADKIDAYRKKITTLPLCAMLVATDTDPDFVNRSISEGKRFNIYAIDKLADVLMGLETGFIKNPHNLAILKSLIQFRDAGVSFTGEMALAAASDKFKVDAAAAKLLVRHTVAKGTASTQASSTMNALQTLGIVINRGDKKRAIWQLTDTPQSRRLEEVLAA